MTKSELPLDERIAVALANKPSSVDLAALLGEAVEADRAAQAAATEARAKALDPATPPKVVSEARKAMDDAQFTRDRLAVATEKLETLRQEADRTEKEAERQKQVDEITVQRDAMAAELRGEYPALVAKLADLLRRMVLVDGKCLQFGVTSSEVTARPGRQTAGNSFTSLALSRIVAFEIRPETFEWDSSHATAISASRPSPLITISTKRCILTNNTKGPKGYYAADLTTGVVDPGKTSGEVLLSEAEIAGIRLQLDVEVIGPGAPVTR